MEHRRQHLRTPPAQAHLQRSLDHEPSIFDTPPDYQPTIDEQQAATASRDDGIHDDHSLFNDDHDQLSPSLKQDSADWDTRSAIYLTEGIVVTILVFTILLFCLRKHHRRLGRHNQRVFISAAQLQEWTTIRVGSALPGGQPSVVIATPPRGRGGSSRNGTTRSRVDSNMSGMISVELDRSTGRVRMDSNVSGMGLSVDRDGRIRVDSGVSGMGMAGAAAAAGRVRMDSNVSGMGLSVDRDGRIRVDSGVSGMGIAAAAAVNAAAAGEDTTATSPTAAGGNDIVETIQSNRTFGDVILSIPRTIGRVLMYPLRVLESGVNDWARTNEDEVFLRQFMERYEADRVASMENSDEREVRLKEAFVKECMIWELDEENFIPPNELFGLGGNDQDDIANCIDGQIANQDPEEVNYGLHSLGEANVCALEDLEEGGTIKHEHLQDSLGENNREIDTDGVDVKKNEHAPDCQNSNMEENVEASNDGADEGRCAASKNANSHCAIVSSDCNIIHATVDGIDSPKDCREISHEMSAPEPATARPMADETEQPTLQVLEGIASASAAMLDHPSSTSVLVGSTSAENNRPRTSSEPTLPVAAMAEDTFEDSTPGYLYLNTFRHGRRRANTNGSNGTSDISSANQSRLSSIESMESFSSAAASSTSQDPHKIPNECAICLCDYEKGDTIITSCNPECPHAFHQECIVEWLVKMQEGTPCPCCRRTFVELDDYIPRGISGSGNTTASAATTNNNITASAATTNNNTVNNAAQESEEAERLRQARRRRHIELGIQRGSRAFNTSVISLRSNSSSNNSNNTASRTPEEIEHQRQERLERTRRHIELGVRRGRAFNTSVISMR